MRFALPVLAVVLSAQALHAGNIVLEWNETTLAALKKDTSAPLLVARNLAIVHLAMRDALKSAGPKNAEAAVTSAAFTTAAALLPSHRAEFEKLRDQQLAASGGAAQNKDALALGETAAQRVLASRANDGSSTQISYIPRSEPGQWRRTPPFFRPPELPQWAANVQPFVLARPDQFRPTGPPALDSAAWAKAFNEVKSLGAKESKTRTAELTMIAKFWSDFSYTETPPGHWNSIARTIAAERKLPLAECARLFATLNVALTDAGIACWDAKFDYNFWRPVTAIPRAAEDGSNATELEVEWLPLLNTPAHPEYPSGHSTFSGAAVAVLTRHFGTDRVAFIVNSDTLPAAKRHFKSLRTCAEECGISRVYGGIHYRFSCEDGMKLGEAVAKRVLQRQGK